ncbi:hypothetical protein Syun_009582 [Stephania yunnanensis]|uniref:Uncharacterized protein n=1 Tax=Stephania yunnanensis TaxID=152371 RepID=A0AAP0KES6_9MAGN
MATRACLGARVGDSAYLTNTARDQVLGQLNSTTAVTPPIGRQRATAIVYRIASPRRVALVLVVVVANCCYRRLSLACSRFATAATTWLLIACRQRCCWLAERCPIVSGCCRSLSTTAAGLHRSCVRCRHHQARAQRPRALSLAAATSVREPPSGVTRPRATAPCRTSASHRAARASASHRDRCASASHRRRRLASRTADGAATTSDGAADLEQGGGGDEQVAADLARGRAGGGLERCDGVAPLTD